MSEAGITKELFRQVMGRFATGVTVVTTVLDGEVHGMTANAYMAGSLTPPLCVVSIDHKARMHGRMAAAGVFGVSFLHEEQQYLSQHFAGLKLLREEPDFEYFGKIPVLPDSVGIVTAEIKDKAECGDHTLYIGEIQHMQAGEGDPLLFYGGRYEVVDRTQRKNLGQAHSFW